MSEEQKKASVKPEKKGGGAAVMVGLIAPALLAAGAAFGGVKLAGGAHAKPAHEAEPAAVQAPGPTVALDPFVAAIADEAQRPHAMKVTLAIELKHGGKEEEFKAFVPRARDATLSYLRDLRYEDVVDNSKTDEMRRDILVRLRAVGASSAEQVLITDLVVQ